ncbi:MAG: hypothetical protein H3Z51_12400 [archaeon]|nr:hypothetical protein [archaeon]
MSKIPENCPICGEKTEKGYMICSAAHIGWNKKKKKWYSTMRGAEIIVWGNAFSFTNVEAHRCPKCKIVLFSYGEKKV